MPPESIYIHHNDLVAMHAHVLSCLPEEACGLLGGQDGVVKMVIPVTNAEHSATRFRMDPRGQIEGMNRIEDAGMDLIGIYHSHPLGPQVPSMTDLAEAAYPDAVSLVWSQSESGWIREAFVLEAGGPRAIPIWVVEGGT